MKGFWSSARARWFVLATLWLVLFVIAAGGFRQQSDQRGLGRSNLDITYLIFQLITLQYNGADSVLNWRLEVARFLAPALAASTVLQSASLVFADEFRRLRLQYVHHHTIVCGLGDVGTRLAQAFAANGDRVVAIEADAACSGIASAKASGVTVLVGDATDPGLLRAARLARAVRVIAVCGNDATNVQIGSHAVDVAGPRTGAALRCAIHLNDAELATLLRGADLTGHGSVRMSFFNTHERAARALLAEHRPFAGFEDLDQRRRSHVVLFGLGELGRSLVVGLAQQWAEIDQDNPMRITLVDDVASGRWEALRLEHPALAMSCDATVLDFDFKAPASAGVDAMRELFDHEAPTWVVIAHVDESLALSTAFFLTQSLGVRNVPIIVRTRTAVGLGALLLPGGSSDDAFSAMRAFPFLDRTCTIEAVEAGVREQLAQAVHEDYRNHLSPAERGGAQPSLDRPWSELDDDERDLSRRRVDGIIGDLAAIGCELVPLRRWGAPRTTFTAPEVERLAGREHERWRADRLGTGWTYGEIRDNTAKQNPLLVPWVEVDPATRVANVEAARVLPMMLARAGFEPIRMHAPD